MSITGCPSSVPVSLAMGFPRHGPSGHETAALRLVCGTARGAGRASIAVFPDLERGARRPGFGSHQATRARPLLRQGCFLLVHLEPLLQASGGQPGSGWGVGGGGGVSRRQASACHRPLRLHHSSTHGRNLISLLIMVRHKDIIGSFVGLAELQACTLGFCWRECNLAEAAAAFKESKCGVHSLPARGPPFR